MGINEIPPVDLPKICEVKRLPSAEATPVSVLEDCLARAKEDGSKGVIVLLLNSDTSQFMVSSKMSLAERCLLAAFLDSYVLRNFDNMYDAPK